MKNSLLRILPAALLALSTWTPLHAADPAPASATPAQTLEVDVSKSPRIIAYQLRRLSNPELLTVIRKPDDAKYKPIYDVLLTRKGLDKKYREEAANALAQMSKTDPVVEILNGIGAVDPDDKTTPRELISLLLTQKPQALAAQKEKLSALAKESESTTVKQAAYAALAVADGKPDEVWETASGNEGGLKLLLAGLPWINDAKLRGAFYPKVEPLVTKAPDPATQAAAAEAISSIPGHEAEEFKLLASLVKSEDASVRNSAIRSLRHIPASKWPSDQVPALAQQMIAVVKATPDEQRTEPAALQSVQLGEDLASTLPPSQGSPIRKALRELSVRVVAIRTLREQLEYDLRYFAVEAGKPVQIVLENGDAMPHNIVFSAPGSLQEIGNEAKNMPAPADEKEKAYVPKDPRIIDATPPVLAEEATTLTFKAPTEPGEYVFLCTFPDHWQRMYGTMIVVPDLEKWEQKPTIPTDPITRKPYDSQKHEEHPLEPGTTPHEHQH